MAQEGTQYGKSPIQLAKEAINKAAHVMGIDLGIGMEKSVETIVDNGRIFENGDIASPTLQFHFVVTRALRLKNKWGKKRKCFWCREMFPSQRTYNEHVSSCLEGKEPKKLRY
jgi:hypothetical protein